MQTIETSERYQAIDVLKIIAAFLIVCIHAPLHSQFGEYFTSITRIAVPLFFMITGFFYIDVKNRNSRKRQIVKIFKLLIISNIIYLVFGIIMAYMSGTLTSYLDDTFRFSSFLKFVLFNESPFSGHLWYLSAILYVLIIIAFIEKVVPQKYLKLLFMLIPLLLIFDLVFGKYSLLILGKEFPIILVRNFLFVGLPYFSIGLLIRIYKNRISISEYKLLFLIAIFVLTTLLERYLLVIMNSNSTRDHYISTTFLAIAFFILFTGSRFNKIQFGYIAEVGKKYSTWIYIIHPIFVTLLGSVAILLDIESLYMDVRPMFVFIITTLFVVIMGKVGKQLSHFNKLKL